MYGKNYYGTFFYGTEGDDNGENGEQCRPDLMKFMPYYYHESLVTKELLDTMSVELGNIIKTLEDIDKQMTISTATWALDLYEQELGIPVNRALPIEERREIIIAKMRGRGTTTKAMIKNTAESFSGGEVDVIEVFDKYKFIVKFVGIQGIPSNLKAFINMLDDIKPAHLLYELEYTYTVWGDLEAHNWIDISNMTWEDVKMVGDLKRGLLKNERNS